MQNKTSGKKSSFLKIINDQNFQMNTSRIIEFSKRKSKFTNYQSPYSQSTGKLNKREQRKFPRRIITSDFMMLAQQKMEIIETMKYQRKQEIGKTDSLQDIEQTNNDTSMVISSFDQKSKRSLEESSSKNSKINSMIDSKQNLESQVGSVTDQSLVNSKKVISLSETPSQILFFNSSFWVKSENEEDLKKIESINEQYKLKMKNMQDNDNYLPRKVKTYEIKRKNKMIQTDETEYCEQVIQTSDFGISQEIEKEEINTVDQDYEYFNHLVDNQMNEIVDSPHSTIQFTLDSIQNLQNKKLMNKNNSQMMQTKMFQTKNQTSHLTSRTFSKSKVLSTLKQTGMKGSKNKFRINSAKNNSYVNLGYSTTFIDKEIKRFKEEIEGEKKHLVMFECEKIYNDDKFVQAARIMDRMTNLDSLFTSIKKYQDYPEIVQPLNQKNNLEAQSKENNERSNFSELIQFFCKEREIFTVFQSDFNQFQSDLIGQVSGEEIDKNQGMVSLWSIINPYQPIQYVKEESCPRTMAFSEYNTSLMAAGFQNGHIKIYDIRLKMKNPVFSTLHNIISRHYDVVWEVKWSRNGSESSYHQNLVSISQDGSIREWDLRKNKETLIKKLNIFEQQKIIQTNFKEIGGFSIDFDHSNPNQFLVSTNDSFVHLCSRNYSENYLKTFHGHNGQIYKVQYNPFDSDYFLTSCLDGFSRVWNVNQSNPLLEFNHNDLNQGILDCAWSPLDSKVFAHLTDNDEFCLWNLNYSQHSPQKVLNLKNSIVKTVNMKFSIKKPVFLLGQSHGKASLYSYNIGDYTLKDLNHQKDQLTQCFHQKK